MENTKRDNLLLISLIVILTCWLRFPTLSSHMPYFDHEDEAHHFNRAVRMVQSGDWNPHYFHKPSLHFYLRAPIIAASFFIEVSRGQMRKIQEIQTKDQFGLGGYALTASHPAIVKGNRAFSLLLSALTLALAFGLVFRITQSSLISALAALIGTFSPALFYESSVIGVDVPMTFFCMAAVYAAYMVKERATFWRIANCSLLAGLAISSKYNALPIAAVPFIAVILYSKDITLSDFLLVAAGLTIGFLAGSPYILAEFPLFLNQFAYEIWHYGIAGHVGHTAEPGIEQTLFYTNWFATDGVGLLALILVPIGIVVSFFKRSKETALLITFPLLFFLLMVFQKANFTRNMIVILPFLAIFAALALEGVVNYFGKTKSTLSIFLPGILVCLILALPAYKTFELRRSYQKIEDSRENAKSWIMNNPAQSDVALAGELGLSQTFAKEKRLTRLKLSGLHITQLGLMGFSRVIAGNLQEPLLLDDTKIKATHTISGNTERQRVPINPEITIFDLNNDFYTEAPLPEAPKLYITESKETLCGTDDFELVQPKEGHCWLQSVQTELNIVKQTKIPGFFALSVMSPWADQKLAFLINEKREEFELTPGKWQRIVLNLSPFELGEKYIKIHTFVSKIHSPSVKADSADTRRLGVAIKEIALE